MAAYLLSTKKWLTQNAISVFATTEGAISMVGVQVTNTLTMNVGMRASSSGKQVQTDSWVGFSNMDDLKEAVRAMTTGEAPSKRFSADAMAKFKQQVDAQEQAAAKGGTQGLLDYYNSLPEEALDTIDSYSPSGWTFRQQRDTLQMTKHLVDDVMGDFRKQGRVVDGGGKQTDSEVAKVLSILKDVSEASFSSSRHDEAMRKANDYVQSRQGSTNKQHKDIVTLSVQAQQALAGMS
jgi:hypothetical protein